MGRDGNRALAWFETHASHAPHHEAFLDGIKEVLILRRLAQRGLEGRTAPLQPDVEYWGKP